MYFLVLASMISFASCEKDNDNNAPEPAYGKYKYGTFILNEGNMTTETGSLLFISPEGEITDSVYFKANGTFLGNVAQDLFIRDNKMYIIAQNGCTSATGSEFTCDGMLVVANAETVEKIASYDDELTSTLSWPTHIAVLDDENIFIRDNNGVYRFNSVTKELKFIDGSEGADRNRMAVANGNVFVPCDEKVLVLEAGKTTVSQTIEMGGSVSGVIKSSDGNIWVSTVSPDKIAKVSTRNYSIIKENLLTLGSVGSGWGTTPGITATGDILYYSGTSTQIHRHNFTTGKSELLVDAKTMVENANIVYNTIAVHPSTGEVYLTTLKAYGEDFRINHISVFDFSGSAPKLSQNYANHTRFPAGIFFTANFN